MKTLLTDNLKYNSDLNAAAKIQEVALRHGLDPELADEFYRYCGECIGAYADYILWEHDMGDDL